MKFAQHLAAHVTPEWHKQYIRYEFLKSFLYTAIEKAPNAEETNQEQVQAYLTQKSEEFLRLCDKELIKIDTFFWEKLAEANRKFAGLKADLADFSLLCAAQDGGRGKKSKKIAAKHSEVDLNTERRLSSEQAVSEDVRCKAAKLGQRGLSNKQHALKLAFSEFYLALILLQNYQSLNVTGFAKIFKKHDKLFRNTRGAAWKVERLDHAVFCTNRDVDSLISRVEQTVTAELEQGDRGRAMKRLRVPPLSDNANLASTFRVGFLVGAFITLFGVVLVLMLTTVRHYPYNPALRMFRGPFLVVLFIAFSGLNVAGWRRAGVNHVLIFETDPRRHVSHLDLLEVAFGFGALWCIFVSMYLVSQLIGIHEYIAPLLMLTLMLAFLFNPLDIAHASARRWLLIRFLRCLSTPFQRVQFADFWLADQLNSLVLVLLDLEFTICYYLADVVWETPCWNKGLNANVNCTPTFEKTINSESHVVNHNLTQLITEHPKSCTAVTYGLVPILSALPATIRLLQCSRRFRDTRMKWHLVNAGKYSTTLFVILFSTLSTVNDDDDVFYGLWLLAAFVSTIYAFVWDVKMDWGLFDANASAENRFLRNEIVYRYRAYYYFAIIEDLLLRCTWILTVTIGNFKLTRDLDSEILRTVTAILEVFRRFVWNFFRLENEHVNNCGQYRAVRDINVAPINECDAKVLEDIMDDESALESYKREKLTNRKKMLEHAHAKRLKNWFTHVRSHNQSTSIPSSSLRTLAEHSFIAGCAFVVGNALAIEDEASYSADSWILLNRLPEREPTVEFKIADDEDEDELETDGYTSSKLLDEKTVVA